MKLLQRFLLFAVNAGLSAALPLVVLRISVDLAGVDAFGAVAFGQSLGTVCAVVISYGWPIFGPPHIARTGADQRRTFYSHSVVFRLSLSVPVLIGALAVLAVTGRLSPLVIVPMLTSASVGLVAAWYFIGSGSAAGYLLWDTMPRLILAGLGCALAIVNESLWWLLGLQLCAGLLCPLLCTLTILRGHMHELGNTKLSFMRTVRHRWAPASTAGISTLYVSLPVVLVGLSTPGLVAPFSASQRVQKLVTTLSVPGVQLLQSWVPRQSPQDTHERVKRALLAGSLGSVSIGGTAFAILPPLLRVVSSGEIFVDGLTRLMVAMVVTLISYTQVTGLVCLSSLDKFSSVFKSSLVGAVVGLSLVVPASYAGVGAIWVVLCAAEGAVAVVQTLQLRQVMSRLPEATGQGVAA